MELHFVLGTQRLLELEQKKSMRMRTLRMMKLNEPSVENDFELKLG